MAGELFGLLATSAITRRIELSFDDAAIINYGGLWGTRLSLCAAIVADIEDSDKFLSLVLETEYAKLAESQKLATGVYRSASPK